MAKLKINRGTTYSINLTYKKDGEAAWIISGSNRLSDIINLWQR